MEYATQALDFSFPEDEDEKFKVPYVKIFPQDDIAEELLFALHQGDNVIGRNETCDIFINNQSLSKEHAVIEVEKNDYLIYDKGSLNKTRKDKLVLKPSVRYNLASGDVLFFGKLHCQFIVEEKIENTSFQNQELENGPALLSDTDDENEGANQDTAYEHQNDASGINGNKASPPVAPQKSSTQDDDDDTDMEEMDVDLMAPTQPLVGAAIVRDIIDSEKSNHEQLSSIFEANTEPLLAQNVEEKSPPSEECAVSIEINNFDQSTFLPNISTEDILCPSTQAQGELSPQTPNSKLQDEYIAETPPHLIENSDIISSPSHSFTDTPKAIHKFSDTTFLDSPAAFETSDMSTVMEKEEPKHSESALSDNLILRLSCSDLDDAAASFSTDNLANDIHKREKEKASPECKNSKQSISTQKEVLTNLFNKGAESIKNNEATSLDNSSKDLLQSNITSELNDFKLSSTIDAPSLKSKPISEMETTHSCARGNFEIESSNDLSSPLFTNHEEKTLNTSDDTFKLPTCKAISSKHSLITKAQKTLELASPSIDDDDLPPTQPYEDFPSANYNKSNLKTATSILEEMAEIDTEDMAPTQQLMPPSFTENTSPKKQLQFVENTEEILESTQLYEPNNSISLDHNLSLPKTSIKQEKDMEHNGLHSDVMASSFTRDHSINNEVHKFQSFEPKEEENLNIDKSCTSKNYEKNIPFIKAPSNLGYIPPSPEAITPSAQTECVEPAFNEAITPPAQNECLEPAFNEAITLPDQNKCVEHPAESMKKTLKAGSKKRKKVSNKSKGNDKDPSPPQNDLETNRVENDDKPADASVEKTLKKSKGKKTFVKAKSPGEDTNNTQNESKHIKPFDINIEESVKTSDLEKGNKEFDFKVPEAKPRGKKEKGTTKKSPKNLKSTTQNTTTAQLDTNVPNKEVGMSLEMTTNKSNTSPNKSVKGSAEDHIQMKAQADEHCKTTQNILRESQKSKDLASNVPLKVSRGRPSNKQRKLNVQASELPKEADSQESTETLSQIVRFIDGFTSQEPSHLSTPEETTKNEPPKKPSSKFKSKRVEDIMKEIQNDKKTRKESKCTSSKQTATNNTKELGNDERPKTRSTNKRKSSDFEKVGEVQIQNTSKKLNKKSKNETTQESPKSKSLPVRRSARKIHSKAEELNKSSEPVTECRSSMNLRGKTLKVKLNTASPRDQQIHSAPVSNIPSQEETLSQIVAFVNEPQSKFAGDMPSIDVNDSIDSKSQDTPETLSQICNFINLTDPESSKNPNKSIVPKSLIKSMQNESSAYIEVIKLDAPKESDSDTTKTIGTRSKTSLSSNKSTKISDKKRKSSNKDLLMEKISEDHYLIKANSVGSKSLASEDSKKEISKIAGLQEKESARKKSSRLALKKKNDNASFSSMESVKYKKPKKEPLEKLNKVELDEMFSHDGDFIIERKQTRKRKSSSESSTLPPSPKVSATSLSKKEAINHKNIKSPSIMSDSTKDSISSKKDSPQTTPHSSPHIATSPRRGRLRTKAASTTDEAKETLDKLNAHLLPTIEDQSSDDHSEISSSSNPALLSRREHTKPRVMFTGILGDESKQKMVRDLHGEIATSSLECTHLITDKFRRTIKALACIAKGTPIVTLSWLKDSAVLNKFLDFQLYLLSDPIAEEHFKFCLALTLNSARHAPLLSGWSLHVTPHVVPSPEQLKEVILCGKGKFLEKMPTKSSPATVVISCPEDRHLCQPAKRLGIPVVTAEFLLTGLLQYELNVEKFAL